MEQPTLRKLPPRPRFDDLPLDKDGPRGNVWGLFSKDDELGLLNYLTPDVTREAAQEIRSGLRIPLDLPLNFFQPAPFGRKTCEHRIIQDEAFIALDDEVCFNPQSSTQWDGFKHCAYQDHKLFYNGPSLDDIKSTKRNGIHAWVKNGGIATRGVLLDFRRWADSQAIYDDSNNNNNAAGAATVAKDVKPVFERTPISAQDLHDVLAAQPGTQLRPGDVLLIYTGYLAACSPSSSMPSTSSIGLEQSEEMLRLLWDAGVVAVASDAPALEAWPPPLHDRRFWLHEWLLAGWGCPIGEFFDLERLGRECAAAGRWSFFFSSMPLNVEGGVSSPVSGIAIL